MSVYVLVVDDDPDAREVLSTLVKMFGRSVKTAASGQEALAQIKSEAPGLILLDLMMPQMSGFEVLNRLMADPEMRRIPVIVVSAYDKAQNGTLQLPGVKEVLPKGKVNAIAVRALLEKNDVGSEPAHLRV